MTTAATFVQPDAHDRPAVTHREAAIEIAPGTILSGRLTVPSTSRPLGVVAVASASRDPLLSRYNRLVVSELADAGFAALLIDCMTPDEKGCAVAPTDPSTVARRLLAATNHLRGRPEVAGLPLGYVATAGAGAGAMGAAADIGADLGAIVSIGAATDLLDVDLERVKAPVLLIVGGTPADFACIDRVRGRLTCPHQVVIVPGSHKLTEGDPRPFRRALMLITRWFAAHLDPPPGGQLRRH